MSANHNRIAFEALRSLAFGGIGAAYAAVGTISSNPIRMIKIFNTTDIDLIISTDGVSDHDIITAGSGFVYDYGSNSTLPTGYLEQPKRTLFYVKQAAAAAASLGSIYITIIYASKE